MQAPDQPFDSNGQKDDLLSDVDKPIPKPTVRTQQADNESISTVSSSSQFNVASSSGPHPTQAIEGILKSELNYGHIRFKPLL